MREESNLNDVHHKLLRSIENHDGQWGWYQLDRAVNPRDLPDGMTVMDVLSSLEASGLIVQQSATPQNKFAITEAGRKVLS
jgi:DNA-binding PadR family transcriptional regulator